MYRSLKETILNMRVKALLKYLPVLSIVLVAGILLVIVILFTLRNINAQNERMKEFTYRQGVSVIRTLEAGSRTRIMDGDWGIEDFQKLIEQVARDSEVEWVGLIRDDGKIMAYNDPRKVGIFVGKSGKQMAFVVKAIRTGEPISAEPEMSDGKLILRIWKAFTPLEDQLAQRDLIARQTHIGQALLDVFDRERKYVIFLGLRMDRFEEIRRQDYSLAVFMAAILFVIGSASVYFIFVVQNAYLVRRTLDEMRTYTKNVQESMANGLITVDRSLRVATFNPNALDILRKSKDEVDGRPINEVLPLEEEIRRVLSDSEFVVEKEVKIAGEEKEKTFLALSVTPLKEPDSQIPRGAVIILRDMTIIRELEQKVIVSEKFAALGRLSAGVAHEIRNPLNSIRGFIQYFQKKLSLDEEDYRYTDLMLTEVDRLNRVISKLLAYSKPREPRLSIRSPEEIIDHCLRVVEREAAETGVTLEHTRLREDMPLVLMDTDQITQVFLNILINAIEATPKGGRVSVKYDINDPDRLHIVVEDTGNGIPRENQDKLFDPFFSTKKKGTGLGLAIVKTIVEGHGGEIDVESEPEAGTRFTVIFSTYRDPNEKAVEQPLSDNGIPAGAPDS